MVKGIQILMILTPTEDGFRPAEDSLADLLVQKS